MEKRNVIGLFSPEEYADLVAQTDAIFQSSQSADDVIQAVADRIAEALEQDQRARHRAVQAKGIAAAREKGVHLGRPRIEPPANFPMVLKQYLDGNLTATIAASLCGVAVSTFYRMKREVMAKAPEEYGENRGENRTEMNRAEMI